MLYSFATLEHATWLYQTQL